MFNEVFVYWFPNLGFSFCLLGMVVGLNLAGSRVATLAQLSYVALALGGVLGLAGLGLLGLGRLGVRGHVVLLRDRAESAGGPAALRGV